jgi:hypothetical protein
MLKTASLLAFRIARQKTRWYKVANRGGWFGAAANPGRWQGSACGLANVFSASLPATEPTSK